MRKCCLEIQEIGEVVHASGNCEREIQNEREEWSVRHALVKKEKELAAP